MEKDCFGRPLSCGPVVGFILLTAACGAQGAPHTPTATETAITPSPTPNVATYDMEEVDSYRDGIISMRDLMDQRKGKECIECENFDFDLVISQNDVNVARSKITPGEYNRRIDLNNDGLNNEQDFTQIADDIGDPVPTGGEFRADELENGHDANRVIVRFEPGTEAESILSELKIDSDSASTEEELEKIKEAIRERSLGFLGLNEEWGMESFLDPRNENGFEVTLVIPKEVLDTMPLGEVIESLKTNPNVSNAFRYRFGDLL